MNTMMPNACCQRYPKKLTNGFTLVELMVSIFIGLILLTVMSLAFLSNKQSYRAQDTSAQMQENGRYAIEVLTRDIRMAGFWGGFEFDTKVSPPSLIGATDPTTCTAANWAWMAAQRVYGLNVTANTDGSLAGDLDGCLPKLPTARSAGDLVLVRHASPNAAVLTTGHLYLISDIDTAQLFTGTAAPAPPDIKTPNSTHQMNANAYYLRDSVVECSDGTTPGKPLKGLKRLSSTKAAEVEEEEIIGGVEDFQVVYGVDNAKGGVLYSAGTLSKDKDYAVDFYADASSALDWSNVISVRIWLLLRAACGENSYKNTSTYTNPSDVKTTILGDSIRRQVFTTTINLRNPRY